MPPQTSKRRTALPSVALVAVLLGCGGGDETASAGADATATRRFYVTATTVEALAGTLESVTPPVEELFAADPLRPEVYLKPMSCLGHYGPVGPWGPLGLLGPVGDSVWSPSVYVSGDGSVGWSDWANELAEMDGPLSASGPLGHDGPLGPAYWEDLPSINDFAKQVQAGGVWTVLGPVGPLGPLGPLGALGPTGAHGLSADDAGNYVDEAGDVVRTIDVPWDEDTKRSYELYESYIDDQARSSADNDTSFMVSARASSGGNEYAFTSASKQFVTVAVVPESASMFLPQAMSVLFAASAIDYEVPLVAPTWRGTTDDFDLELVDDASGKIIAASASRKFPDWVQVVVPKGAALRARVTLKSSWDSFFVSPISRRFRLFVTGSTKHIAKTDIRGAHQVELK